MQPHHRQPPRCHPSQLGAAVAASRSASQTHVVTSQPNPRDKGAWASADQASAAAPMLRPASGRPGSILVAACLTAGRKRSPEGSRTKKESISSTPGLLRCLRPFDRGAYLFSKSDLLRMRCAPVRPPPLAPPPPHTRTARRPSVSSTPPLSCSRAASSSSGCQQRVHRSSTAMRP